MAIDPYAPCPCGSGKKLKFCCSDLAHDIEKVHRLIAGDQPHAALEHLRRLLEKEPERASLLDLCANLELSVEEFDTAEQTIRRYLAAHPQNPSAHAQQAILIAATGEASEAVPRLQDALELLDDDMPLRVFEAIGAVGHALLVGGSLVAGRGHLMLYAGIAPEGDNMALELLLRMNLQAGLPLLMREYLLLKECPDEAPWQTEFRQAERAAGRGQWRIAEEIFASLHDKVGPEPCIVYNLAVVRGWLGDDQRFADGLHEYARLDVQELQAVEAEALAQLVNPSLEDPALETVRVAFAVADEDGLSERLAIDKRVEDYPLDQSQFSEDDPLPRSGHVLLDKPTPPASADLAREEIPRVLAFLSLSGKRTDRDAQLELTTDRTSDFDSVKSLLREVGGEALGEELDEEVVDRRSQSEESLSWRWRLPPGTPVGQRRQLVAQQRREAILQHWIDSPRAALGNKSPAEAALDPGQQIALLASALIIEQAAVEPDELSWFDELREKLGLPSRERIDPDQCDIHHLPMVHVPRLELASLTVGQLNTLLDRATMMGAALAKLVLAKELVGREDSDKDADLSAAYRQLVRNDPDLDRAQQWVAKARKWAQQHNRSVAEWALMDLEVAIQRGDSATAQRSLDEIRTQHINQPGIAEATYRLLYSVGAIDPQDVAATKPTPLAMAESPDAAPAGAAPGLWTPESTGQPPPGERKSAIWTP